MSGEQATILLVDDDADTRGSIQRVLEKKGYHVLDADGPVEAREISEKRGKEIDVLILDVIMPGMSGIAVADEMAENLDDPRILFISGFIEGELPERHESPGATAFLQKPFSVGELLAALDDLLGEA